MSEETVEGLEPSYEWINIENILVTPEQDEIDEQAVQEIADSIRIHGILHPIAVQNKLVREKNDQIKEIVVLVAGGLRREAMKRLGQQRIPCKFVQGSEVEIEMIRLSENLWRKNISVLRRAEMTVEYFRLGAALVNNSGQSVRKSTPGRPQSGIALASRNLPSVGGSVDARRKSLERAIKISAITPEAKRAAIACGLANNQGALLKIAQIVDSLSNEMISNEQVVGPGLKGNPRWDKTILQRLSGALSPTHYISRTSHRSFELPENQLLAWLVDDLRRTIASIEQRLGTSQLHASLLMLRDDCEAVRRHHWFGDLSIPLRLTPAMLAAAKGHRRPEYRQAAALARRRSELETNDHHAWWYTVLSLLAVNWLEPVSGDDLFELYVLVLVLDLLGEELGFGEPIEYGLVTSRRSHVAALENSDTKIKIFFDQTPATVLGIQSEYSRVVAQHRGLVGGERRPDILLLVERANEKRLILIEMKKSADDRYISDSVYKVFGYLYDFTGQPPAERIVKAILVVPSGVSAKSTAASSRTVFVSSADDRAGMIRSLKDALN